MQGARIESQSVVGIEPHMAFARMLARQASRSLPDGVEESDLEAAAMVALYEAAQRFDPARGVPFRAFAKHRIRGAILDRVRQLDHVPVAVRRRAHQLGAARQHLTAHLGRLPSEGEVAGFLGVDIVDYRALERRAELRVVMSLDAPQGDSDVRFGDSLPSDGSNALDGMMDDELRVALRDAVAALPVREKTAIVLVYFHGLMLKEVGQVLGVSESRVCQLCKQGIARLRIGLSE